MARGQAAAGGGSAAPTSLSRPHLTLAIEQLAQAEAALAWAAAHGVALRLASPVDGADRTGALYWRAMECRLGAEVTVDCGGSAGLVMAGLRVGLRRLVYRGPAETTHRLRGMAATLGGRIDTDWELPFLQLTADDDARSRLDDWAAGGGGDRDGG